MTQAIPSPAQPPGEAESRPRLPPPAVWTQPPCRRLCRLCTQPPGPITTEREIGSGPARRLPRVLRCADGRRGAAAFRRCFRLPASLQRDGATARASLGLVPVNDARRNDHPAITCYRSRTGARRRVALRCSAHPPAQPSVRRSRLPLRRRRVRDRPPRPRGPCRQRGSQRRRLSGRDGPVGSLAADNHDLPRCGS
jgi:hypothetical protein